MEFGHSTMMLGTLLLIKQNRTFFVVLTRLESVTLLM